MKLKQIEKLPVAKVKRKGKLMKLVEGMDGLIILDLYKDKNHLGRYVMELATGAYKYYTEGAWYTRKLYGIMNDRAYDYWWGREPKDWKFETDAEYEKASKIIGDQGDVFYRIDCEEGSHNREKSEDAYYRKKKRIAELMHSIDMADVPELVFEEWWLNTCESVKGVDYMFYDKEKQKYGCTACGKSHDIQKGKHRQKYICSRTGVETVLLKRQQAVTVKDYAIFIQNVDDKCAVERLVEVETYYAYSKKIVNRKDTIRVMLSRTGKKAKLYYNQEFEDCWGYVYNRRGSSWWDQNGAGKKWHSGYLYPMEKDVLKGTEYSGLRLEAMSGLKMNYNALLMKHKHAGCFEYLVKMGLHKLAEEESEKLGLLGISTTIDTTGSNAEEILGINMQRIHRLKQLNGGTVMLMWLRIEQSTGKKIPQDTLKKLLLSQIDPSYFQFIMDRMSAEKLINYLSKQYEINKKSFRNYSVANDWKDYLSMAKRLGMDTQDPIVYAPRNLKKRHDELVEEIARIGDDLWIREISSKYPDVEKICQSIREKYEYSNDKYMLIVPQTISGIVDDGRQLHHCSASSERYFDRINKRECYLVFARKKEEPEKAWYTVEIQPGGTIRQKRTAFNRQDDEEEVMKFLKEWQKVIKKRLTKEDMELEQASGIQREIEQMELLQKGDEKSLRVWQELENDFLTNEMPEAAAV